ncbi:MAG TPA: hypothetical protein DGT21_19010 [Armatimonadetes bacterium]|jgi:hypothetical protein|nr:hypothetical protein [Armatimonadota bacterium]
MTGSRALVALLCMGAFVSRGCLAAATAQTMAVAADGHALASIVLADDSTPAEQTAARELATYLEKITGAAFETTTEAEFGRVGPAIFVGQTLFATAAGVDFAALADEEWVIRSVDGSLVLGGGRPRGTLYAVYEFLQETLGCYWLTWDAEVVPEIPDLSIPALDVQDKPAFRVRCVSQGYYVGKDLNAGNKKLYNDFTLRNRGNYQLANYSADRGGQVNVRPRGCHTFYDYVKPSVYYQTHPEYYLDDGAGHRAPGLAALVAKNATEQELDRFARDGLCLSNPDVYAVVMQSLRKFIAVDRAKPDDVNLPFIYDFSQMDDQSQLCRCPECKALFEEEGSDSGPVLRFVNAMAEEIGREYPDILIRTFAYVSSEQPPRTIRPADNVMVQYCDLYTKSDCYRALTHPVNADRLALLQSWGAIARHVMVWDYWNFNLSISAPTPGPPDMVPPSVIHSDMNTFHDNNVTGLYIEAEGGVNVQNFHDLGHFLAFQLMLDPHQPWEPLVDIFMGGYYGPAATPMKAYLEHLDRALAAEPGSMSYAFQAAGRLYPTAEFYATALELLDEADGLCPEGSPEKLRVWREKVPVYNGLLHYWDKVSSTARGPMPFDRPALLDEYHAMRAALISAPTNMRSDERRQEALAALEDEMALLNTELPIPEQFAQIPRERLRHVIYPDFGRWRVQLVDDADTPAGKAIVYYVDDPEACTLPLTTGLYDDFLGLRKLPDGEPNFGPVLQIEQAPADEKYHWYRIGRYSIGRSTGVYGSSMFRRHPWPMRVNLHRFYTLADGIEPGSPNDPNLYDVYVSLKITGPAYVPGSTQRNGIWTDWVILVRPEEP